MLYIYTIIISILIGLLRKGKLSNLTQISFKRIELLILACLIQGVLVFFGTRKVKFILDYSSYAMIFSYIVLIMAVWYNKKLKGIKIITLGIIFNFVVIIANGGHMPVLLSSLYRAGLNDFALILKEGSYVTHTLITEKTLCAFLADVFPLPPPFPDPSVVSVGDFLMFFGVFSLFQNAMLEEEQNLETSSQNSEDKKENLEA